MDKNKTCKDCPDRTVQPNCHMTCEGYKARQRQRQEANNKRLTEYGTDLFRYDVKKKLLKKYFK